ncbi:MAG: aminoacyl-tRNA hydrolase [Candidatus Dormibacteria bacterium]
MSGQPLLVLGLGNPGPEHLHQRHNVGADALHLLAQRLGTKLGHYRGPAWVGRGVWQGRELVLAQPRTYMNESGLAGARLLADLALGLDQVVVIYDDLDLAIGRLRLRAGGSPGGHNGIRSLQTHWRSQQFARVRIGIGRPPPGVDPIEFVLGRARGREKEDLERACARAAEAVLMISEKGLEEAMTEFNRVPAKPAAGQDSHAS